MRFVFPNRTNLSDVTKDQHGASLHLNFKVTFEIGHSTVRRTFLHYGGTDDALAGLIDNCSRNV